MHRLVITGFLFSCLMVDLSAQPLRVGVSLLPLGSLVTEIGGEYVEVSSLQGEGDSCSVFEPRPSAIAAMAQVSLYFRIGAAFESALLPRLQSQFPGMEVMDARDGLELLSMAGHDHGHHDHEECSGHDDPHIWLDPQSLQGMAWNIARGLSRAMPGQQAVFEQRAEQFCRQLDEVHEELKNRLLPHRGKAFFIYHPALGYFGQRYELEQIAIEASSSGSTLKGLQHFINRSSGLRVKAIFVQPQEDRRHAEIVASAIGAEVIEIDPMSTELVANLRRIGILMEDVFSD